MSTQSESARGLPRLLNIPGTRTLAVVLAAAAIAYIAWKIGQSPPQALQFAFNGLAVGAVYALLAMGFTLVYSTVWFFDLYYGAAAAMGAYGVFYLRTSSALGSRFDVNSIYVNAVFAAIVAGVVGWTLHQVLYPRLRGRFSPNTIGLLVGLMAGAVGAYAGIVLSYPAILHVMTSPAVGIAVALAAIFVPYWAVQSFAPNVRFTLIAAIAGLPAAALGAWCGYLLSGSPGAGLYLSWAVSCLLAGCVGLALYRGLYVYMRQRARSPLIMLVASLGILLAIAAFIVIVFESAPRGRCPTPSAARPGKSPERASRVSTCSASASPWPVSPSFGCCSGRPRSAAPSAP